MEWIKKFVKGLNLSVFDMVLVGLMVIGGVMILWGLYGSRTKSGMTDVEYLAGGSRIESGMTGEMIWVDVSGAVEKPGVYELGKGSRIKDALVVAGGLSEGADREYLEKIINMAEEVEDGQKIYIPRQGGGAGDGGGVLGSTSDKVGTGTININSASASELDTLWGVGPARAQGIIDNRPFGKVEELLEKGVLPENVYEEIKDKVSVY
ncbi:helix-hairpin-helix domain-containing protein [Patescibacteria group bacterium]|nr:helix-hairpin-helix domain-containing protein [Patescibacteria group bacterium]MBU1457883.1 helix-hairpin-helix domain-containing protein [Patescibacteria group bacterium]